MFGGEKREKRMRINPKRQFWNFWEEPEIIKIPQIVSKNYQILQINSDLY